MMRRFQQRNKKTEEVLTTAPPQKRNGEGKRFNYLIFLGARRCALLLLPSGGKTMITHKKFTCSRQLPNGRVRGRLEEGICALGQLGWRKKKKHEMDKAGMEMRYNFCFCDAGIRSSPHSPPPIPLFFFLIPGVDPSLIFSMAFLAAFLCLWSR